MKTAPDMTFQQPFKRSKRSATPPLQMTGLLPMDNLNLYDPFNHVTPDINEFGRFHPIPGTSNSSSPVRPRAIHPWVEVAPELDDAFQLDLEEPSIEELEDCWGNSAAAPIHLQGKDHTTRIHRFAATMEQIHHSIKECIMTAAKDVERGHLVSLVSNWAKQVAASPLGEVEVAMEEV